MRSRKGMPSNDATTTNDTSTAANANQLWRHKATRLCRIRSCRWRWILLCTAPVTVFALVRLYYVIELSITDPFIEASVYFPFRTFYIRYLDDKPEARRTFRSTANNTFVINLERDTERRHRFEQANPREAGGEEKGAVVAAVPVGVPYQFFSATQWAQWQPGAHEHRDAMIHNESSESIARVATAIARQMKRQEEHARTYAFVGQKTATKHFGDAASTLSHIRLMEQLLSSTTPTTSSGSSNASRQEEDYYFIFEDDAVMKEPFRSTGTVQAPGDAHVVFLVEYATKKVKVAAAALSGNRDNHDEASRDEVRVVQGYGAMGYVVTRTGAELILEHLRGHAVPADVALAGEAHGLRVYQPVGWPLVGHRPGVGGSRRHAINNKEKN